MNLMICNKIQFRAGAVLFIQYLTGQILAFFGKTCPVRYCGKIYEAIFRDKNN